MWQSLAADALSAMKGSRPVLLGKRDPNGPSCIRPNNMSEDKRLVWADDPQGGCGTLLVYFYLVQTKRNTPSEDFRWHQKELPAFLEKMKESNAAPFRQAAALAAKAEAFAAALDSCTAFPADLKPSSAASENHWPGHCVTALDIAIGRRDLAEGKRWAEELAAASFALADLHRWLDFLIANELTALEFQGKCEEMFTQSDREYAKTYDMSLYIGRFPAGKLASLGLGNYLEIERQAERLFRVPQEFLAMKLDGDSVVRTEGLASAPAGRWLPPDLRDAFAILRSRLSPANQETLDEAAHTPFDRSYLANMLYRLEQANALGPLAVVLKRFDALHHPKAPVASVMSVLFYRGGDFSGGSDWDDRFDRRLMEAAGHLTGDNEQALLRACEMTHRLFAKWENYENNPTLESALNTGKMDCNRATDMIGSLFRNSGHVGFYNVRLCTGSEAHTVAAAEVGAGENRSILLADGLDFDPKSGQRWPEAYAAGYSWPSGGPFVKYPPPYTVELHVRGIDSYVWAEGYVLRGPNAGTFIRAETPYLPNRPKTSPPKAVVKAAPPAK